MAVHNPGGFHFPEKKQNTKTSINLHKNSNNNKKTNKQTINQEISILLFHVLSMPVLSGGSFLHTSQMLGYLYIYGIHVLASY